MTKAFINTEKHMYKLNSPSKTPTYSQRSFEKEKESKKKKKKQERTREKEKKKRESREKERQNTRRALILKNQARVARLAEPMTVLHVL